MEVGQQADFNFLSMMVNGDRRLLQVKKAYVPKKENLQTKLFLDFLLVGTKGLTFKPLLTNDDSLSKELRFYSGAYRKSFPRSHFTDFDSKGHSFYIGKLGGSTDMYILCEPLLDDCSCRNESSAVSPSIADFIMYEIIIKSLGK
jgi:hypothetical protein